VIKSYRGIFILYIMEIYVTTDIYDYIEELNYVEEEI